MATIRDRTVIAVLALLPVLAVAAPLAAAPRPNIVFILTDDQRWDTIDKKHSVTGTTPVMPKVQSLLVNKGVLFQNHFVTTALCCPSRSSILAGKYAHTTGVHDNGGPDGGVQVFDDSSTLPVWLHDAGYHTGIFGKYLNGYAAIAPYIAPGWDEWHVFKAPGYFNYHLIENGADVAYDSADADYSTDVLRDKVLQFIAEAAEPFFVEFTPYNPHAPATPAPRHVGSFAGVAPWRPRNYAEPDASDKPAWVQSITWTQQDQTGTDTFRQRQLECLQSVDEAVDAVVQALKARGVLASTIIMYSADNGYSWGSHRWKPKQCEYEECMRDPLIVRYAPLVPRARKDSRITLNIDFAQTFAELAGATPDPGVEGRSLVPLLDGSATSWRTDMLNEHWNGKIPTFAQVRGLFTKPGGTPHIWKYVELVSGEKELYNLDRDPFELSNVAGNSSNAALVATMAARLRELDPGWTGSAPAAAAPTAFPPDYANDDAFE
ncbi:MAG: sulfatase [Deltaproteobacteria bacterium]|nr:MAG: sulfatase [Deltaproteobacteria bacterium]